MPTPGGLVTRPELIDAQLDVAHLGRVVNSKDAGGNPITQSTNRTGGVNKTLNALQEEYQAAIRDAGGVPLGVWTSGVTEFTAYNQYAIYNGIPYKPRAGTTLPYIAQGADPTAAPDDAFVQPYAEVQPSDITDAQEDLLPPGSSLFKGDDGAWVKNGDTIPVNSTHLRVLVGGEPTILVAWDTLTLPATITSVPVSDNGFAGYSLATDQGFFELVTLETEAGRLAGNLKCWGGVAGKDDTVAAGNSTSLSRAIDYFSGGVNSEDGGGEIDLGKGVWTFGPFTINERWGWTLKGSNQSIYLTGAISIKGCANYICKDFMVRGYTPKTSDGFIFDVGETTGERNHNFAFINVYTRELDNGLHAVGSISQAWFYGGQHGANNKSINFESGFTADHIYFVKPIFADHTAGSTAFECFCNNWELIAPHFETNHGDGTTTDVNIGGQQGKVVGGVMTQSGQIKFSGNNATVSGMTINNSSATEVIRQISGELSVTGNVIRWESNNGTGNAFTDGLGKTGIKGTLFRKLSDNEIKNPGVGINTTGDRIAIDNNFIDGPATYAYLIQNSDNVKINGGTVALKVIGSVGVRQQTSNGAGCSVNNINWQITAGERYQFDGSQIQVHDSGEGSPNGVIYGGAGSTYSRINNPIQGRTNYVKFSAATSNTAWMPEGIALVSTLDLSDATNIINTEDKRRGVSVLNTDTNVILLAESTSPTGRWYDSLGNVVVTPT